MYICIYVCICTCLLSALPFFPGSLLPSISFLVLQVIYSVFLVACAKFVFSWSMRVSLSDIAKVSAALFAFALTKSRFSDDTASTSSFESSAVLVDDLLPLFLLLSRIRNDCRCADAHDRSKIINVIRMISRAISTIWGASSKYRC